MRPVLEVADVFRRHGEAFRHSHGVHLGRVERRVMSAVEQCRTAALGGHAEQCGDCGLVRHAYNSCRNRHCPKCQGLARAEWLEARQAELLPVPYYHVVFTPAAAGRGNRVSEQARCLMPSCSARASERCATLPLDPRHLGAEMGAVAVLHTWGQTLQHHPHLHCIVPGGGLSPDQTRWVSCRPGFFLPVRVLSQRLRNLFLAGLQTAAAAGRTAFLRNTAALNGARGVCRANRRPTRGSTGWFTLNDRSPAPSRSSPISAATRIASPSPTAG